MNANILNIILFGFFIFIIVISFVLPYYSQKKFIKKYQDNQQKYVSNKYCGYSFCRFILWKNKIDDVDVKVNETGQLDYYSYTEKTIYLNEHNYHNSTITAIGVSGHEAMHAVNAKKRSWIMKIQKELNPVNNFFSIAVFPLFLVFLFTNSLLIYIVLLVAYFIITVFNLIILIIEIDASLKLVKIIKNGQIKFKTYEFNEIKKVLKLAAMTYLWRFLTFFLIFIYFLINIIVVSVVL